MSSLASMRPGQLTPENRRDPCVVGRDVRRFNEAGAINPGKPRTCKCLRTWCISFNEAGAINPGKRPPRTPHGPPASGFNEAGAINPGKRGGHHDEFAHPSAASMRPGQLTPENTPCRRDSGTQNRAGFNEAGAINPGKPTRCFWRRRRRSGFNEAGAINPGKHAQR